MSHPQAGGERCREIAPDRPGRRTGRAGRPYAITITNGQLGASPISELT